MSRKRQNRSRNNEYFEREQQLNRMIRQFQRDYYNLSTPPTNEEYLEMDEKRRQIKYLIGCQEYQVWQKSPNRKHAYFSQLSLFKSIYMMWKRLTVPNYLEEYHHVPHHVAIWVKDVGTTIVPGKVFGT